MAWPYWLISELFGHIAAGFLASQGPPSVYFSMRQKEIYIDPKMNLIWGVSAAISLIGLCISPQIVFFLVVLTAYALICDGAFVTIAVLLKIPVKAPKLMEWSIGGWKPLGKHSILGKLVWGKRLRKAREQTQEQAIKTQLQQFMEASFATGMPVNRYRLDFSGHEPHLIAESVRPQTMVERVWSGLRWRRDMIIQLSGIPLMVAVMVIVWYFVAFREYEAGHNPIHNFDHYKISNFGTQTIVAWTLGWITVFLNLYARWVGFQEKRKSNAAATSMGAFQPYEPFAQALSNFVLFACFAIDNVLQIIAILLYSWGDDGPNKDYLIYNIPWIFGSVVAFLTDVVPLWYYIRCMQVAGDLPGKWRWGKLPSQPINEPMQKLKDYYEITEEKRDSSQESSDESQDSRKPLKDTRWAQALNGPNGEMFLGLTHNFRKADKREKESNTNGNESQESSETDDYPHIYDSRIKDGVAHQVHRKIVNGNEVTVHPTEFIPFKPPGRRQRIANKYSGRVYHAILAKSRDQRELTNQQIVQQALEAQEKAQYTFYCQNHKKFAEFIDSQVKLYCKKAGISSRTRDPVGGSTRQMFTLRVRHHVALAQKIRLYLTRDEDRRLAKAVDDLERMSRDPANTKHVTQAYLENQSKLHAKQKKRNEEYETFLKNNPYQGHAVTPPPKKQKRKSGPLHFVPLPPNSTSEESSSGTHISEKRRSSARYTRPSSREYLVSNDRSDDSQSESSEDDNALGPLDLPSSNSPSQRHIARNAKAVGDQPTDPSIYAQFPSNR